MALFSVEKLLKPLFKSWKNTLPLEKLFHNAENAVSYIISSDRRHFGSRITLEI
jgi:hypothetical protein